MPALRCVHLRDRPEPEDHELVPRLPAGRARAELMATVARVVPIAEPFDFALTAGHQTNYRGKAGSDLFADGVYYRALWMDGEPLGVAARPVEGGIEVSLPNGGPERTLDFAAERVAWLLGIDVSMEGFHEMLADDPVLSDTAGALRASEMDADVLLKATRVNGVFDRDPEKHVDAVHFPKITYIEALNRRLQVMDATAFSLCMQNNMPIVVFELDRQGCNLPGVLRGESIGTRVEPG